MAVTVTLILAINHMVKEVNIFAILHFVILVIADLKEKNKIML